MKTSIGPSASRRIKSLRMKSSRSTFSRSDGDHIPLDLTRNPNDNLKEILSNMCNRQGITTARKLGHLNNLVRLYCSIEDDSLIDIPMEIIMSCLKATLVSDVKEVRAAGVRALRYIINDNKAKETFTKLHLDHLITKCLDISHFNEVERIQAIRLIRKLAHLKHNHSTVTEPIVPLSLFACIVSVSLGGAEERDRVYRTCLAVLCELAVMQPYLLLKSNGVLALINAILECHMYHRISECLCMSLMHLIDHPTVRENNHSELNMGATFAPFTELNYRLHPDVEDAKLKDEQEMRFMASKMAIVSLLRTWSGMLHICNSDSMVRSFVEALLIPSPSVRRGIMAVLCDLFYFNELNWTDDFDLALNSAAPGNFKDTWRLTEGFVVAEGKCLLPVRAVARPDLVDCQLAVLLSAFLRAGLLQSLATVSLSSDSCSSVAATILLGTVLHLASRLLPGDSDNSSRKWHLPDLLRTWSSEQTDEQLRINIAVKQLQEIHVMLRSKTPAVYSHYLTQLLSDLPREQTSPSRRISGSGLSSSRSRTNSSSSSHDPLTSPTFSLLKKHRTLNLMRDFTEDHTLAAIKHTKVLSTTENREWDWEALECLFLSPPSLHFLRSVATDDTLRRFYRRLIFFFLPANKLFSSIDLAKDGMPDHNRKYVSTACHMVQFLAHSDEEGQRLLKDMITTIVETLQEITSEASGYSRSTGSLLVTCSREYFLIMGSLSCDPRGDQVLGHCKVYHYFLGLASDSTSESLIKLMVSSLHYSEDSPSRAVLNKVLTSCNEAGRLYGTGFLRVLLRANCPGFKGWGTDLLTTQLFDPSNDVAAEALDILHEACDDREYLQAVVKLKPTLLHLGERGAILVCRFLSEPQGFAYLSRNKYLARELDRWWKSYNERYVIHVEELLKLSLTTYERPNKEEGFVRRSGHRKGRQSVYLPAHLYGELCRHEDGARVVEEEQIAPKLTRLLSTMLQEESGKKVRSREGGRLLKMKSCLWALAHIGSTALGLPLLQKCEALPVLARLASGAGVASVRGTSIYCLNCIAQTIPGVEVLRQFGWKSVLRTVNRPETITPSRNRTTNLDQDATPRMTRSNPLSKSVSMSSQWSAVSGSPRAHSGRSPRRSTSSASASSTGRMSRSRGSSRTDGGSMHKIKRRNSKKSSLPEDSLIPSPSSTSASTSVVSSHSSISEVDGSAGYPGPTKLGNSPSPIRGPVVVKPSPRPNKKDHRRTRSTTDDLTSRDSLSVTSSKTRIKDRVIELFFKRSKNRSSLKTPNNVIDRKKQQDDSSSGYVSDHHPFEHADWRSLDQSSSLIEEVDDDAPPSPLHHAHSALANQQLASSVDTLKVCDVIEVTPRQAQIKRNSSDFSLKTDLSVTPCNAGGEMSLLSTWNTNNSGQSESTLHNGGERTRAASRFYLAPTDPHGAPEPPGQRFQRARSLPDVLDARASQTSNNREPVNDVISRQNQEQNTDSGKSPRNFAENRALTDLVSSDHWRRSDGNFHKFAPPDHFPSPLEPERPLKDHSDVIDRDASPQKHSPAAEEPKGGLGSELRNRGNTEVSHDSGYGLESSPVAVTSLVDDATRNGDATPETDDPFYDADWRLSKPTGLAAVRIFNQHTTSPVADIRKTLQDVSERFPDTLDPEEREEIVQTTRYVGIAVPDHLDHIFQPLDGKTAKDAKSPSNLLSDWKGLIEDDGLPDMNPGRRKVNELLQGRKFRGLDEYTFGPAVAAALKASSSKPGKSHSTANTPCARTPDSIMSEASDLCYLGGHTMEPGSDEYVAILHQEIVQLVTNLGSSVGIKAHETALLMMKEKRPEVFDSLSLYNSIVEIMSQYSFRLTTRRFVQELFQDVHFTEVYLDAQRALQSIK